MVPGWRPRTYGHSEDGVENTRLRPKTSVCSVGSSMPMWREGSTMAEKPDRPDKDKDKDKPPKPPKPGPPQPPDHGKPRKHG
jgi:hypothetical protein